EGASEEESPEPCEALVPVTPPSRATRSEARTARAEPPPARPEPLPPSREVSEELETQPVADVPRWMPSLRGVMLRARAIQQAATGPLPAPPSAGPLAQAWPAVAEETVPSGAAQPGSLSEENDDENDGEDITPASRLVERATPLQRAVGSAA